MPTFEWKAAPSPSRISKPNGPRHSTISHKIRILISRQLMFERKATRKLSSNIDHQIAMYRVLLPDGVASPCSSTAQSPLNTTVMQQDSWGAEESQGIRIKYWPKGFQMRWPCNGSGGQSTASHCDGSSSTPGQPGVTYCKHVSLGQAFSLRLRFSPFTIILPTLQTHLFIHSSSIDAALSSLLRVSSNKVQVRKLLGWLWRVGAQLEIHKLLGVPLRIQEFRSL